jgi:hypothetical protein
MSRSWLANTKPLAASELPARRTLIGATLLVMVFAVLVVVTFVLPAELGIDVTGIGRITGLTEMGVFKVEAAKQFAEMDAIAAQNAADAAAAATLPLPAAR